MKSLEIEKIDQVFTEIENWIQNDPEFLSSYWVPQRNRYKSDIQIINTFYEGGEILEVGSVPCYFTAMLKLLGYPVVGVDLFPQRAQLIIDRYGLTVQKCNIEAEPLPFPDGTFKYVLFTEVFEHLRVDPLLILSEINRVLTDGGLLMLSTPNLYAIQKIVRYMTGRGFGEPLVEFEKLRTIGHMGHVREYTNSEIRKFLVLNNFRVVKTLYRHYYYPKTKRGMLTYVVFHVSPPRFRSYQVVLARKVGTSLGLVPLPDQSTNAPSYTATEL